MLGFGHTLAGHFQHQMVFIVIAPVFIRAGRWLGNRWLKACIARSVKCGRKIFTSRYGLGTPLQVEEERHFVRAKFVDHQEGIFVVFLCNIIDIAAYTPQQPAGFKIRRMWRRISVRTSV